METHNAFGSCSFLMKYKKTSPKKKIVKKRTNYTLKYNQELRNDWPEKVPREWERLEEDEAFKEGFLLAMNNISLKISTIRKNGISENSDGY
jgi:hypothetical protein